MLGPVFCGRREIFHGITNATLPSEFQSSLTFAVFLKFIIIENSGEGLSSQSGSTSAPLLVAIAIVVLVGNLLCSVLSGEIIIG